MKNKFTLTLIGLAMSFMAIAQSNRTNPDDAQFFIKGNLSIEKGADGKTVYKLSQIDNQGIYFDNPEATRLGEETSLEDVIFQFSRASTDYPGGINTPLNFWRYDDSINEWQPDGETRQGTAGVEDKKSMVVMLVLDCSSSIGSDFSGVQNASKGFIKSLYDASKGTGNIKLGIVSFSRINETKNLSIRPLTSSSYNEMISFINRLSTQNGTALYYAMDQSINMMEEYCKNSILSTEPLSAAIMVTFTDGLDQTSRNPDKNIFTADNYYDELLAKYGIKIKNKHINGIPLQHEIRGVKGDDIISNAQLGKFRKISESLGNFKLLDNYSELSKEFNAIAANLIDQWRILKLYVPNSFSGRVAWTYPSEKPKEKPRIERNFMPVPLFGLNVGGGGGYSEPTKFLEFSAGLDLAIACSPKFALGIYGSYKTTFQTIHQVACGLNLMIGPQQKAFLLGLGCNVRLAGSSVLFNENINGVNYSIERYRDRSASGNGSAGADLRLGGVFKGFYFFFDFSIDEYTVKDFLTSDNTNPIYWQGCILPQATFNIGINFMQLGKKNKNNKKTNEK